MTVAWVDMGWEGKKSVIAMKSEAHSTQEEICGLIQGFAAMAYCSHCKILFF